MNIDRCIRKIRGIMVKYDIYAQAQWFIFRKSFKKQITFYFDERTANCIMKSAKNIYREIVLRSPGIGGRKNPMTTNVLNAALVASIYKAGEGKITPEQMGKILSDAIEEVVIFKLFMKRTKVFTKKWQDKREIRSQESKFRKYDADFVSDFIYGESVNEFGTNFHECGICKLLQRENMMELAPEMCKFDYIMVKYMGANLRRTKTIANGDGICDFWYSKVDER